MTGLLVHYIRCMRKIGCVNVYRRDRKDFIGEIRRFAQCQPLSKGLFGVIQLNKHFLDFAHYLSGVNSTFKRSISGMTPITIAQMERRHDW